MPNGSKATCRLIKQDATFEGKQGFPYFAEISAQSAGASGICMVLLTIPPGWRARAHKHDGHETAIFIISGEVHTWYGDALEHHVVGRAGEFL